MDPLYEPSEIETRQVYGVSLQQRRNDVKIDASLFKNIVTKNQKVRRPASDPNLIVAVNADLYSCPNPP
jgi:phosphoribosylaminoimidazolecarboxamide formyltransferase/IMP cyclohydrolase